MQSWWSTNARKNTAPYTPVFRTVFEKNTAFLNLTNYFPDITAPKTTPIKNSGQKIVSLLQVNQISIIFEHKFTFFVEFQSK